MSTNSSIASILDGIRRSESETMEAGLLSAYRMVTIAQIAISIIFTGIAILTVAGPDRLPAQINMGWMLLLTIYLCWPYLHVRLGRWFLPIALSINSFFPMLDRELTILRFVELPDFQGATEDAIVLLGWRLVIFMLFPAVIVAWQYGYKGIGIFIGLTAIVDLAFAGLFSSQPEIVFRIAPVLTIARSIFYFMLGLLVIQLLNSQREQQRELAEANEQLASYAATVDQLATSRERNRLARELHDTLSHTLSALSVQLEAADSVWKDAPDQAHDLVIKSIANARSGLAETRRALQDLRASPLEDLGLGLALRNLAESTAKRAGLGLTVDVPKQIDGLAGEQEQGIYRIAQEALENVVKHSNAKTLYVNVKQVPGDSAECSQWQLTVADDGIGFEQRQIQENGHYGLQGMQERAAMLGGMLHVESEIDKGTEIRLSL